MARQGKIARLPFEVREELNQQLLDNRNGPAILNWINAKCALRGQAAITAQNLSEWRAGGFAEWLQKHDKVQRTKSLAEYCLRLADAGGGSMDLPASIAGGQLMEVLEDFDPDDLKSLLKEKPESWLGVLEMLARLQRSKADELKARQGDVKLAQSERALNLAEAKFQRETAKLFLKWYADKRAAEIAEGKGKSDVKIEQLRLLMFGEV